MTFELHPNLKRDGIVIGHFDLCVVLLINDMTFPWFVLVPQRDNIRDTIDLSASDYDSLFAESKKFSDGIMGLFSGEKLNVAALGNVTPQLHLHHVVRFEKDAAWPGAIWGSDHAKKPWREQQLEVLQSKFDELAIEGLHLKPEFAAGA